MGRLPGPRRESGHLSKEAFLPFTSFPLNHALRPPWKGSEQGVGRLHFSLQVHHQFAVWLYRNPFPSLVSVSLPKTRGWVTTVFLHLFFKTHTPFWINIQMSILSYSIYGKPSNHFPNQKL